MFTMLDSSTIIRNFICIYSVAVKGSNVKMPDKNPLKIPRILWFQILLLAVGYAFYSANRLSFGVALAV